LYLNCHTHFSLHHGTLSVDDLVGLAQAHGISSLALTDIHNTSACYDFVRACRAVGIDPVVGMEFRRGDELLYVALARNLQGFREINEFYSQYAHQGLAFPDLPPYWSEVCVVYPWEKRDRVSLTEREWLGIRPSQVRQLVGSRYRHRQDRLVILQPITFADGIGHKVHRVLRAVDHNLLLGRLTQQQQAGEDERFVTQDQLMEAFAAYPRLIANSEQLLSACSFNFVFGQPRTKQAYTGHKYDDLLLLEKLAREGLAWRYGRYHPEAARRLERELEIIDQLDFNAYFLITWDFIQYGRSRGFFHVGRGSGANSLTAYCLGITDVDPIELDLYFERFLNPKRSSPPDFDIDYAWTDRDAVLDYVLKRYRSSHAVLLASYQRFQPRSAIRALGKVFGLPKQEIDILSTLGIEAVSADPVASQVLHFAKLIQGWPDHLSIHAGGVLIAEAPIHSYTATNLPPKGMPISHFDLHVAEEIGLHKFDILSQRGLGHIREAVTIAQAQGAAPIDIRAVQAFKRDPAVQALLRTGDTIGCFYVESPAMRSLLRKLRCDDYPTLVAASSVIRPGVARSGMMQAFIARHNGEPFTDTHPKLAELLADTYGIMVYQEDVLKVVHGLAGLDLAEADLLRRAMSGKARSQAAFERIKTRFLAACAGKGYAEADSHEIWQQIESFAGYSFSKAHAASYAVESLQSLYLKAHYPLAFITAVINNFGGFYSTENYLHEARRNGATVHAPCVNRSQFRTMLAGKDIWLGFQHIKGLEETWAQELVAERDRQGDFEGLADVRARLHASESQLSLLVRVGAFRFTGKEKATLLWEAKWHRGQHPGGQRETLFAVPQATVALPALPGSTHQDAQDEQALLGFTLASPFDLLTNKPPGTVLTRDLSHHVGQVVCLVGDHVCTKTVKTVKGERMQFANFMDEARELFDVVIFPPEVKSYPVSGAGVYLLTGMVTEAFGVCAVELMVAERLADALSGDHEP
jgi:DNA polymerase-3 subunit alpha